MRYLLDTHVVIWWLQDSKKLGRGARRIIASDDCCVSVISIWEMITKQNANQLRLPAGSLGDLIVEQGFQLLPLTAEHIETGLALNDLQGDPFDRMMVGVAKVENLTLLTRDAQILERAAKHLRGRLIEV
jgi:PIN domain nuclease of toxin-antitoxin system